MAKPRSQAQKFVVGTLTAVSQFFGVSGTTIDKWRARGMPVSRRGYDLSLIARWRLERGDVSAVDDADGSLPARLKLADVRKAEADAEIREAKRDTLNGSLVERSVAAACLERAFAIVASRLQSLPEELATSVDPLFRTDLMTDAEQKIRSALDQARREIVGLEWTGGSVADDETDPQTEGA